MNIMEQTRQKDLTRVGWVNDFNKLGGGEESQKRLIERATFTVDFMTPKTFKTGYGLYIINNVRTFTTEQVEYLLRSRFVMCWRDVLSDDHNLIKGLAEKAFKNIFLSPLHLATFKEKYGLAPHNQFVIPPLFDDVQDADNDREGICWFGSIWPHKGIESVLLWARNNNTVIDFYGTGHEQIIEQLKISKYANYKGLADKTVLKEYKYFIHMPTVIEAFGRAAFEAFLAGCHVLHNGLIGAFSFDWNYENKREALSDCSYQGKAFWDVVVWS